MAFKPINVFHEQDFNENLNFIVDSKSYRRSSLEESDVIIHTELCQGKIKIKKLMEELSSQYASSHKKVLLFILDDFKIITDYSKGLQRVMPLHFWRIWLFNIIMLIAAVVLLANKDYYLILIIYIIFVLILGRYYLKNASLIYLRNPI